MACPSPETEIGNEIVEVVGNFSMVPATDAVDIVPYPYAILTWFLEEQDVTVEYYDLYVGKNALPRTPSYSNLTETSYNVPFDDLEFGALYLWKVVAKEGEKHYVSETYSFTTLLPQDWKNELLPASSLTAELITDTAAHLRWVKHSDDQTFFVIERKISSQEDSDYAEVATLNNGETFYQDTALIPETRYSYRIKTGAIYSNFLEVTTGESEKDFPSGGSFSFSGELSLEEGKTIVKINDLTLRNDDGSIGNRGIANSVLELSEQIVDNLQTVSKKISLIQATWPEALLIENYSFSTGEITENIEISGVTYAPSSNQHLVNGKGFLRTVFFDITGFPGSPSGCIIGSIYSPSDLPTAPENPQLILPKTEKSDLLRLTFTAPDLTIQTYDFNTSSSSKDKFQSPTDLPDSYLIEGKNGGQWYKLALIPAHQEGEYISTPVYELPTGLALGELRIRSSNLTGYSETALEFNLNDL